MPSQKNMETQKLYEIYKECPVISTDTRKIQGACLFFALKGPNFNGNAYALQALEAGALWAICDEVHGDPHPQVILVPDALKALQALASFHIAQLGIPVLAITGSNGKTTTKELTARVLAACYKVYATQGNFNNHIGVPLSILAIAPDTEIAVLEMGDNRPGDITELCQIAHPTHGIITNIGKDHLEGFGSWEGNLRAKSELFDYFLKQSGVAIVNREDPVLQPMARRFEAPVFYGGADDPDQLLAANPFIVYQNQAGERVETQLPGDYNFANIRAAACFGRLFHVPESAIHQAIATYQPQNNRSQWISHPRNTILQDAYNANPSSVSAALGNFSRISTPLKKAVILGDMFELGETTAQEHKAMVELALAQHFDLAIFCGKLYANAQKDGGLFFADKQSLHQWLAAQRVEGYMVLLKGSRGMQMETVVNYLTD